jgi:hypothetical protein
MSKQFLTGDNIRELIGILRDLFQHHQKLRRKNMIAEKIQLPKIPSSLSESLIVDLGNRKKLQKVLPCSNFVLSEEQGDVVAELSGREVKIEVKATARSAFQLLSPKDINSDFLVWVHFDQYFENEEFHEIEIFVLKQPQKYFHNVTEKERKMTLTAFKKRGGTDLVRILVNLDYYLPKEKK